MAIKLQGYVFKNDGTALSGATVQVYDTSDTSTEGTAVTSDSNGLWTYADLDTDALHDVKISSGGSVRWRMGEDKIQIKEAYIRNDTGATQGGLVVANATNSASNKIATFANLSRTGADNDEIYLSFEMLNDADVVHEFARMTVVAKDVSNTGNTEDGEIQFDVMKSGTLTKVWSISSSTSGATSMDMDVDSFTIGTGADTDITLTFDANTADGVITWMEDEDYFKFSDEILMNSTEKILFGDTGTFIHQSADGVLTITSDTTVDINGAVAFDGAITGATNITLSGELDAATLDISGNADIDGTLEADAITIGSTAIGSIYGVIAGSSSIVTVGTIGTGVWAATDVAVAHGGTGASTATAGFDALSPMTAEGDVLYGGSSGTITKLAKGSDADVLTLASGVPSWATPTTGDITGVTAGVGLSGGGTAGALTITLDLSELSTVTPADGDFFSTLDSDGSNEQKTTTTALATLLAGTGLTASSSVIGVDAAQTQITSVGTIGTGVWQGTKIAGGYIADNAIDSVHYADGSIDNAHIADDQIDSEHYADGSIDNAHIADDAIDSEHYAAASVDYAHIQNVAANSILVRDADSTGVLSAKALATTQILIGDGTGFTAAALSGDATMANDGAVTVTSAAGNFTMGDTGQLIFSDLHPASDHTASGIVITIPAGENVGIFDAVFINTDGELHMADANQATTMPAIGISLESKTDGQAMKVLIQGVLRDDSYAFTVGADIFISAAEVGGITATAPSGSGDTVQKVGVALSADEVYFNFNTTEILLA